MVAAVYSLFVATCIYRELKVSQLYGVFVRAALTTSVIMFLVAAALVSSWLITVSEIATQVVDLLKPFMGNQTLLLAAIMVIVVIVGTALDMTPTILILTPILMPVIKEAGIDPVYFGVLFIVNNSIGLITPPVGVVLNVVCRRRAHPDGRPHPRVVAVHVGRAGGPAPDGAVSRARHRAGEMVRRLTRSIPRENLQFNRSLAMTARLMILNGPNLNLLGIREPHIYGSTTLAAVEASCKAFAAFAGASLAFHQSNHEGVLVDLIQSARQEADALIINPAAYSFTSIAMLDAFKIFEGPIFEVHVSNIHARDELHRHSKLSSAVKAVIAGLGPYGYIVAMQAALQALGKLPESLPEPIGVGPK